jgi:hypothetical protein
MSEQDQPGARSAPKKSILGSNTTHMAFLTAASYLGARHFKASEDVQEGIALVGIAMTVIFLRRSLIHLFDTAPAFESEADRERIPKPLYRSMTVISAILMVVGWMAAKFYYNDPMVGNVQASTGVLVIGAFAVAIFLRRGILHAMG